ncbi:hypothetical protein EDD21DRAFT_172069 [Dissophora ornata]|nr:hypothetical protein EDD21DRAFT_172069 [Dissophora ornata]
MKGQDRDPLAASAMDIMNFFAHGLENLKWKLGTARTYKASILQLLPSDRRRTIAEDNAFKEFLSAMGSSSFKRIRNDTIDLTPVFQGLRDLGDNHNMDIKNLTIKTCFLLAVCGLLRPDELECTDAAQCKVTGDKLVLQVMFPKELRGGQMIIKPVVIQAHPVEALCPVKAFVEYRRRTADQDRHAIRPHPKREAYSYTPLLRQIRKGNLALGSERISKYIQEIMSLIPREEGHPRYKARALGATVALGKGNWSSPAIVNEFCRISRSLSNNFTTAIFS